MSKPQIESVAKAIIINSANKVLILTLGEHLKNPDKSFKPDLPGGLVDPGETERDAVIREVYEETGISLVPSQLEMVYARTEFINSENKSVTKHLYIAHIVEAVEVELSWEHSAYEWVKIDNLQNIVLKSFYDEAVRYCFKNEILS